MIKEKSLYENFTNVRKYIYTSDSTLNDFGALKHNCSTYIFQDRNNKNLAYKIYKPYKNEWFNKIKDAKLIQNLYTNGTNIYDIDFPLGVITYDDRIIGQVINYYNKSIELYNYKKTDLDIYYLLMKSINLIKELCDNNIFYLDIHEHNFLITNGKVKLIDFDSDLVGFKSSSNYLNDYYKYIILSNFKSMVKRLLINKNEKIYIDLTDNLEMLYERIQNLYDNCGKTRIKTK